MEKGWILTYKPPVTPLSALPSPTSSPADGQQAVLGMMLPPVTSPRGPFWFSLWFHYPTCSTSSMCDPEGVKTCKRLAPAAGTPNLPLWSGKRQVRRRRNVPDSFTVVWHWALGVENFYLHIGFEIICFGFGNVTPVPQNCKNSPQGSDLPTWKQFCASCVWEKEVIRTWWRAGSLLFS